MTELAALKRSKTARHSYVVRMIMELKVKIEEKDAVEVEEKLEVLKIKEAELYLIHQQIEQEDDKIVATDIEAMEDFRTSIILAKVAAHRFLKGTTPLKKQGATSFMSENAVKLPKLQIRKFDGSLADWERFWDQFAAAIHDNSGLANIDKMNYLKSLLVESAALTIAGLQLTSANYLIAVDLLKQKYGREDVLQEEHFLCLLRLKPPMSSNAKELRRLLEELKFRTRALAIYGKDLDQYSGMLCPVVLQILPMEQLQEWYRNSQRAKDPQFNELITFVQVEVEKLEALERMETLQQGQPKTSKKGSGNKLLTRERAEHTASLVTSEQASDSAETRKKFCAFCEKDQHWATECEVYASVSARKEALKRLTKCFKCLGRKHVARDCKKYVACRICKKPHHTALCYKRERSSDVKSNEAVNVRTIQETEEHTVATVVNGVANSGVRMGITVLQTLEVIVHVGNKTANVKCLVDGGSERSFITTHVARTLGLPIVNNKCLKVNSFGNSREEKSGPQVTVPLMGRNGAKLEIDAFEVPSICSTVAYWEASKIERLLQGRRGVWSHVMGPANRVTIDLLVGADWYWKIMTGHMKRLSAYLMATESIFGWTLQGRALSPTQECAATQLLVCTQETSENMLNEKEHRQQQLFKHLLNETNELLEEDSKYTSGEEQVLENFKSTIRFENGRYTVAIPWNSRKLELCRNFGPAKMRLRKLLYRLKGNPELQLQYGKGIQTYLADNHAEEVAEQEPINEPVYYMPHHPIVKEERRTTKLRIVFDASAHEEGHYSLNDCQESGPNLNPDVLTLLLQFRQYRIAMSSDIEKAFLQIKIRKEDRNATRFLWCEDSCDWSTSSCRKVFRMTRVLFGMKASPFLLAATVRFHAIKYATQYPRAAQLIDEQMYVDDCLNSSDTVKEAAALSKELRAIMAEGGFWLVKWATNSEELRQQWRSSANPSETVELLKVLGLFWNTKQDILQFKGMENELEKAVDTKRGVLSLYAKVFDPLGFISPFVILARLLLQKIWKKQLNWDAELPTEILQEWLQWKKNVLLLSQVTVNRWLGLQAKLQERIHIFCDASEKAYGCVVYVANQETQELRLVASKARVAPLKVISLPRLELTAVLEGAKLWGKIEQAWKSKNAKVTIWTDSMIALQWIQGDACKWKMFVARRVKKIRELCPNCVFKHCSSKQNRADILTRGQSLDQLLRNNGWWGGPEGIIEKEVAEITAEEMKCINNEEAVTASHCHVIRTEEIKLIKWEKYSKWGTLVRVTGWAFRFLHNCRGKTRSAENYLTVQELEVAKRYWLRKKQEEDFKKEIQQLQRSNTVDTKSVVGKFRAYLDQEGLLRIGGRLGNAKLTEQRKHVLLMRGGGILTLVVMHAHEVTLHGGVQDTLQQLRKTIWLINGRQEVRKILRSCKKCCRWMAQAADTTEGMLPVERVTAGSVFSSVGVDFAGPLLVKKDVTEVKMYICLFTCASSRAVHLELVTSLSVGSFLLAFRRFIFRRPACKVIFSDNAKCFEQANRIIHSSAMKKTKGQLQVWAAEQGITWKFIPPKAAWWGGFYERLIGAMKRHLRRTLGRTILHEEELRTLLTEIEAAMNSRPLTALTEDADDTTALTPFNLMYGNDATEMWDVTINPTNLIAGQALSKRWRYRRTLIEQFWKRWREEYLLQLRTAHEVRSAKGNRRELHSDELVLIHDEKLPRGRWALGQVCKLIFGRDGKARSVVLKTQKGSIRRAIQHCYPLECRNN